MRPTSRSGGGSITGGGWRVSPAVAIDTAQHPRLAQMRGADARGAVEIGNGAREPQHPLARPARESPPLHRRLEQALAGLVHYAPALHAGVREARIAALLALELHRARAGDARDRKSTRLN